MPLPPMPAPCAIAQPLAQVCACLTAATKADDPAAAATCELAPTDLAAGLRTATITVEVGESPTYVLTQQAAGWVVIAEAERIYNPGAFGIMQDQTPIVVTPRTVGAHAIVELRWSTSRFDRDYESEWMQDSEMLMIYALGDRTTPARCSPSIPTKVTASRDHVDEEHNVIGESPHEEHQLDAVLDPDGTLRVTVAKGTKPDAWTAAYVATTKPW